MTKGKRSPDSSLMEYEFNRDVGRRLKAILERHGVEVIENNMQIFEMLFNKSFYYFNYNTWFIIYYL